MPGYVATYLERDVRQVLNVGDLAAFQTFLGLVAGNVGRVLNPSELGASCGIAHTTARAWLGVLEAGCIVFRLPPFARNRKKRLTRRPKLYFYDSGLVAHMLGIRSEDQLRRHPLRGAIFEGWVISGILKARVHRGLRENLFFYRDHKGQEVDLVLDTGSQVMAAEMMSGMTVPSDALRSLDAFARLAAAAPESRVPELVDRVLVHGGEERQARSAGTVLPWRGIADYDWTPDLRS